MKRESRPVPSVCSAFQRDRRPALCRDSAILGTRWTREHLRALLSAYLQQDLGNPPKIYIDERSEHSPNWAKDVANHLARSKVLLAVLSGDYFNSPWCAHELDLVLAKMNGQPGLFFLMVVHDCEELSGPIGLAKGPDFSAYRKAGLQFGTPEYTQFGDAIQRLTPKMADAIDNVPDYEPAWEHLCVQRFLEVYESQQSKVFLPPTYYTLPPPRPRGAKPAVTVEV